MLNTMNLMSRVEIRIDSNNLDMSTLRWGDICFADFGNPVGSEQGGIRPVLIIQNNKGNEYAPTTIAAAITSQDKKCLPTHVVIKPYQSGLNKVSTIMCEQIRTIDKSRIKSKVGHINVDWLVEKIKKSLTISLST